jgi:hypothetical protein
MYVIYEFKVPHSYITLVVIYISTLVLEPATSSPESFLRPYLDATLTLAQQSEAATPIQPLFTIFYNQELPPRELSPMPSQAPSSYLVMPVNSCLLPDSSDTAATNAEAVFWEAVRVLKPLQRQSSHEDTETQRYSTGINSFWPPPPDVDALEEWW